MVTYQPSLSSIMKSNDFYLYLSTQINNNKIIMSEVVHQQTLTSPNNNQNNNQKVVVLDYASLRNLGCKNVTENNE